MNYKKIYIVLIAILFLGVTPSFAQEENLNKWAVQLNLQHQDLLLELNFGQLRVADEVNIRPHYSFEVQRFFKMKSAKRRMFAIGELGYFDNLYHDKWLGLKLGVGSERQLGNFIISSRVQAGAARTKGADIQYVLEEGKWVVSKKSRQTTLDFLMSPRIDVGYRIVKNEHPIDVFLNYQMTLYISPTLDIGIPYHGYGFGLRYGL